MPEEAKPTTQTVSLPSGGSIPGIPGEHGPGTYLIDWINRTIERIENALRPEPISTEAPVEQPAEPSPEAAPVETPATSEPAN